MHFVEEDEDCEDDYYEEVAYQIQDNDNIDDSRNVTHTKQHNSSIGSVVNPTEHNKSRDDNPSPVSYSYLNLYSL